MRLSEWLSNVKTRSTFSPTRDSALCEKHFVQSDFFEISQGALSPGATRKRLKRKAVPLLEWTSPPPSPLLARDVLPSTPPPVLETATSMPTRREMDEKRIAEERDRKRLHNVEAEKRLRQKILRTHLRRRIRRCRKRVLTLQMKVNAALMKVRQLKRQAKISEDVSKRLRSFLTEKGMQIMEQSKKLKKRCL